MISTFYIPVLLKGQRVLVCISEKLIDDEKRSYIVAFCGIIIWTFLSFLPSEGGGEITVAIQTKSGSSFSEKPLLLSL